MGGWGIPFLISTSPSEGRRWSGGPAWISGRAPTGSLPLRCCRPRRLPSAGPPGGRDSIVGLPSKPAVRLQVAWRGGCQATSPHGGRKAIMSRDRRGLWELQEQRSRAFSCGWGPGTLWGIWRGPGGGGAAPSTPHAALWPCGRGRRNIWGWPPPPPSPVPYQGFLPAGLTSRWTRAWPWPLGGRGPGSSLLSAWGGAAASSAVTHLAPRQYWAPWTRVKEEMGVVSPVCTGRGGGACEKGGSRPPHPLPLSHPHILQP